MSATAIFIITLIAAGVVAVLGIFAVALRRGSSVGPITTAELDPKAVKRDRDARKEAERTQAAAQAGESGAVATLERTDETDEAADVDVAAAAEPSQLQLRSNSGKTRANLQVPKKFLRFPTSL